MDRFRFSGVGIKLLGCTVATAASLIVTAAAVGQTFEIVEPSGAVSGWLEVDRDAIRYRNAAGERRQYNRNPADDTRDGRFLGYFNFELNRVMRFPRSGVGPLLVADLDDPRPVFQPTSGELNRIGPPAATRRGRHRDAPQPLLGDPYGEWGDPFAEWGDAVAPLPRFGFGQLHHPPQSILLDSRTVANAPLPPVAVRLVNTWKRELQVTAIDLADSSKERAVRIPPGAGVPLVFARDSGGARISRYRTYDPFGLPRVREVVTPIPPAVRYELVVHEWAMQSVAIDRTGKSPQVIEDINFQGRGIGRFPLPPGDELQAGDLDVFRAASAAQNPGVVSPLVPADGPRADNVDKLQRAVWQAQQQAQTADAP